MKQRWSGNSIRANPRRRSGANTISRTGSAFNPTGKAVSLLETGTHVLFGAKVDGRAPTVRHQPVVCIKIN